MSRALTRALTRARPQADPRPTPVFLAPSGATPDGDLAP
jgi:hypothetical protein